MDNARELACEILMEVLDQGGQSHQVLRKTLNRHPEMERRDRRFVTHLVQGTIEYQMLLDEKLNQVSKTPVTKMKPLIRELLRLSTYQLLFLDNIPASAVCNEAVKITERRKFQGLKSYVNGVLRNISRDLSLPEGGLPLRYSTPEWLVRRWQNQWGEIVTERILQANMERKPLTIRVHTSKASTEQVLESLSREDVAARPLLRALGGYAIRGFDQIQTQESFRKGWIQVQDISSMLAVLAAAPAPGSRVLDVCAAPGGKSMHLADLLAGSGSVTACDLTEEKADLIRENRDRCGFENLQVEVQDARSFRPEWEANMDLVLADLPCSGLGTISHKPEIKYRVTEEAIHSLAALQREILSVAWRYVKPGGKLLFSTCTIEPEENQRNYQWMLANFPLEPVSLAEVLPVEYQTDTAGQGWVQLLQGQHPCDGFFISAVRRR